MKWKCPYCDALNDRSIAICHVCDKSDPSFSKAPPAEVKGGTAKKRPPVTLHPKSTTTPPKLPEKKKGPLVVFEKKMPPASTPVPPKIVPPPPHLPSPNTESIGAQLFKVAVGVTSLVGAFLILKMILDLVFPHL